MHLSFRSSIRVVWARLASVVVVLFTILTWFASTVSASSDSPSRLTYVVVSETRVGVADIPAPVFVGLQPGIAAAQVGKSCPDYDGTAPGSCVATNSATGASNAATGPALARQLAGEEASSIFNSSGVSSGQ